MDWHSLKSDRKRPDHSCSIDFSIVTHIPWLTPTHFRSSSSVLNNVPNSLSSMSLYFRAKNTNYEAPHNAVYPTLKYNLPSSVQMFPVPCSPVSIMLSSTLPSNLRRNHTELLVVCLFVCFPGVTIHCGCIFHSPVAGFSLLVSEVSWSHTTTRHSR
jgi:hypothetical protein